MSLSLAKSFDTTGQLIEEAIAFPILELEVILMQNETPSEYDVVLPLGVIKQTDEPQSQRVQA